MGDFDPDTFLPRELMDAITTARVEDPNLFGRIASDRIARSPFAPRGRLCLLALDHPARGVTRIGDEPTAMADRRSLLARAYRVLQAPDMDGVMGSMDILQDLLVLDHLAQEGGRPSLLNGRALVASMNRGGVAGSAWELDDPWTGPGVEDLERWNLDGGKLLVRLNPGDTGSLRTLEMCSQMLRSLSRKNVPCFLEPLPVTQEGSEWRVSLDPDELARMVGIATALGESTHRLGLKLPWCRDFSRVARSTTLPILLLGGATGEVEGFLAALEEGLETTGNLRGAMVGRSIL